MSDVNTADQKIAIKEEAEAGVPESSFANTDYVEVRSAVSLEGSREEVTNDILNGSRIIQEVEYGKQVSSGTLPFYLKNSSLGLPKWGLLLETFGFINKAVPAMTIEAGSSTTVINITDTENCEVGDLVLINGEKRRVISMITDVSITLDRALSEAPEALDVVAASNQLRLVEKASKTVSVFQEIAQKQKTFAGGSMESGEFNFVNGEKVEFSATMQFSSFAESTIPDINSNPDFGTQVQNKAELADVFINGTRGCISDVVCQLSQEIVDKTCIGYKNAIMAKRGANPYTINLNYKQYAVGNAWTKQGDSMSMFIGLQNVAFWFSRLEVTNAPSADESGVLVDNVTTKLASASAQNAMVIAIW